MRKHIQKTKNNGCGGFTLIEMMVSISLFAVVISVALGSFLNMSEVQKKATSLRKINDNLNFAVETMMREIRTGKKYCQSACSPSSFNFTSARGDSIVYRLNNGNGSIERSEDGGTTFFSLTSPEVKVDNLLFVVGGESSSDSLQPIVSIIVNGSAGEKKKTKSHLDLQVTVSQRALDTP